MKREEVKEMIDSFNDMNKSYVEAAQAAKGTANQARDTRQLSRKENKSFLIKAGLALIAFPDPTISDVVGSAMVAAGLVQQGIRRRTLYVEDIAKTFQNTMRDIRNTKDGV